MKPGFTLLELLVSIAIFAGVMVLALGAFARSAASSARANAAREKTELARSVVDQVSNDFRYIDSTSPTGCPAAPAQPANGVWKGFCLNPINGVFNSAFLLLKYPGENTYVGKTYFTALVSNDLKMYVSEQRGCVAAQDCQPTTNSAKPLLPDNRVLTQGIVFTGQADTPTQNGFLNVRFGIKPQGENCSATETTKCYELSTTLVPGGY